MGDATKFAGSVMLGDLDDFIVPSQSCVNPLFADEVNSMSTEEQAALKRGTARISLRSGVFAGVGESNAAVKPDLIKTSTKKTAKVTLNDCLACSGCVTSAETVLISQQSAEEFFAAVASPKYSHTVASVSPQALASLAAHYDLTSIGAYRRLVTYLKSVGVHHVVDTLAASNIGLQEVATEFIARMRHAAEHPDRRSTWEMPPEDGKVEEGADAPPPLGLPMLSSACPGWVCFAEKTHPQAIPYMSTTKSPQQITGTQVKDLFAPAGVTRDKIHHTTIMPCFDKKLEASRVDFTDTLLSARDVDCVLTSAELVDVFTEQAIDFAALPETDIVPSADLAGAGAPSVDLERFLCSVSDDGTQLVGPVAASAGSGGFLDYVFRAAAAALHGVVLEGSLEFKAGRNPDFSEVTLEVDGAVVLQFAKAYGFRNISSVVTKMKRGRSPYHFIEIMACPSGCTNGGGQVKLAAHEDGTLVTPSESRALVSKVDGLLHDRAHLPAPDSEASKVTYSRVGGGPGSEAARRVLHTQFRAVPKLPAEALAMKW